MIERETVVASVLIQNVEGLVLVFESQEGFAAVPGGTSEGEETPEETAIRESLEETGLRIDIEKLVTFHNLIVLERDGSERCRFLHYLYLASTEDTFPRPSSEWRESGAKCRWTTLEDLMHYRRVWPLAEEVRRRISKGELDLGNIGELKYRMV